MPIARQKLQYPDGRNPPPSKTHWLEGRTPDLRYWIVSDYVAHPDLYGPDAELFILVYDAGRAIYHQPANDPMYSAQTRLRAQGNEYRPDYEYTATACAESHRLCLANGPCTGCTTSSQLSTGCYRAQNPNRGSWVKPSSPFWAALTQDQTLAAQACDLLSQQGPLGTIHQFVSARGVSAMLMFERSTWFDAYVPVILTSNGCWMSSRGLSSFLMVRQRLLLPVMGDPTPWVKSKEARDVLCGRVLMIHGDYTNINFPGFLLTLGVVVAISGCSHAQAVKRVFAGVVRWVAFFTWLTGSAACCWQGKARGGKRPSTSNSEQGGVGGAERRETGRGEDFLDENFELRGR